MNTFDLRLDLDKTSKIQVVTIRQGDSDGTTIAATVYDHGTLADLSSIARAYIEFALPDGTHYYRGTATVSGSVVTAMVDEEQAASVPGRACNAYFSLSDGTNEYSTASFVVAILKSAVDGMEMAESWDSEIQAAIQACYDAASGVTVADGSITTLKLADGSVTPDKLSDMVLRGYVRSFETVAAMQASTRLILGNVCHTNGFHASGDGGAAYYKIADSGSIACQNGLYATKINIALSNSAIDEITNGATPSSDGLVDKVGLVRFWDNIQDQMGHASQEQVNAWLDAHPEATTTVQNGTITSQKIADGAVTGDKLADGAVDLDNININALGPTVYKVDTTDGGAANPEIKFFFDASSPQEVTIVCDVTKNAADTWSYLRARIRNSVTGIQKTLETFDNSHAVGVTKHLSVTFSSSEITIGNINHVVLMFERGANTLLNYDVTIENLEIYFDGVRKYPTSVESNQAKGVSDWLTVIKPDASYLATRQWVSDNFTEAATTETDMGAYLMPRYYQVFDDSTTPRYHAYDIYVDYLNATGIAKDVLFSGGSDHVTIWPNLSQTDDVETATKTLSFESNVYTSDDAEISVVSTKASVANAPAKVLCIGDSTLDGHGAENEGWNRIFGRFVKEEDVDFNRSSDFIMLGTRGLGDYTFDYEGHSCTIQPRHEGRSGWSLRDYSFGKNYDTDGNPFYDGSLSTTCKFSIDKWIERFRTMDDDGNRLDASSPDLGTEVPADEVDSYNVCTPDVVVINLGHNDFYLYAVSTYWEYYDALLSRIRSELPDAYLIVCVTMPYAYCVHPELYPDYDVPPITPQTPPSTYYMKYLENVAHWKEFVGSNSDNKILVMPEYNITPTIDSKKWLEVEGCGGNTLYMTKNEYGSAHPYKPAHFAWGYQLYALYKYIQTLTSA